MSLCQKTITKVGEMAQLLRAQAALPEDPGSNPRNHIVVSVISVTPSHRHTCGQNTNAHKMKKIIKIYVQHIRKIIHRDQVGFIPEM